MTKAAIMQLVSSTNVQTNLKQVEHFVKEAKEEQVDLIVLPENFAFMGFSEKDKLTVAEKFGTGEIQAFLSRLASQYKLWIIAGTMPIKVDKSYVRASCLVIDDKGACVARYDKIHLFDVRVSAEEAHQESSTVQRGDKPMVVDTPLGRVGLTVCYDLRFPELYNHLRSMGAMLFTIPSAFTAVTGAAHWEILLRARAIENLCYVLAANQGGHHENGRETYGHSMIVEPWGKVVNQLNEGVGIATANIDLQRLEQLRKQFPCNDHHVLLQKTEENIL